MVRCTKRNGSVQIDVDPGTIRAKTSRATVTIGHILNEKPVSIGGKTPCPNFDCDWLAGEIDWVRLAQI